MKTFGAIVTAALLTACAGGERSTRTTPAPDGVSNGDLYVATLQVFADRKLAVRHEDAGLVISDWIVVDAPSKTEHAWRVSISEEELTIDIDCRIAGAPCADDERITSFSDQRGQLRNEILDASIRHANHVKGKRDPGGTVDPHATRYVHTPWYRGSTEYPTR